MANSSLHVFRIGVFAIIEDHGQVLLARRRDIGWWNCEFFTYSRRECI